MCAFVCVGLRVCVGAGLKFIVRGTLAFECLKLTSDYPGDLYTPARLVNLKNVKETFEDKLPTACSAHDFVILPA